MVDHNSIAAPIARSDTLISGAEEVFVRQLGAERLSFDGAVISNGEDLDNAKAVIGKLFVDHRLSASRGRGSRPINVGCKTLSSVALCFFDYGREIGIEPDVLEDFYLVLVPVVGGSCVTCGADTFLGGVGTSIVLPTHRQISMVWSNETRKLVVRVDRRKVQSKLETYFGDKLTRSPRFDLGAQDGLSKPGPMRQALQGLLDAAMLSQQLGNELMSSAFEEAFLGSLLLYHPSDMTDAIHNGAISSACPRSVKRAEDYIETHLSEPITIDDLALAAGTSARSLFEAFRRFRQIAPMQYVRSQRLQAVRNALMSGDPNIQIHGLAAQWGFAHPGRFAMEYGKQFGELPSETLRRMRS